MLANILSDWRRLRAAAPSRRRALRFAAEYLALRIWTLVIGWFPLEQNLRTARLLGRLWWLVMKRHRRRALENLRHAFGPHCDERVLRRIARASFEHFAQLYLVELVLGPLRVSEWSWPRYVELGEIDEAIDILLAGRGAIMITAHFGNYELLGHTISRLGLPLTAVMRPLDNPLLNDFLLAKRYESGRLSLIYKHGASQAAQRVLAAGGTLCFIADQDAGRKGVFADFFNRPASWYKSIGLLAMHFQVPIIVGHAVRTRPGMHYRLEVERIIRPHEWADRPDPLAWITQTFAAAFESAIRRRPEQYLWVHRRWKTQPPAARRTANGVATSASH